MTGYCDHTVLGTLWGCNQNMVFFLWRSHFLDISQIELDIKGHLESHSVTIDFVWSLL